jgi:ABC-type branched-subunit amino acid transport system substrate-binding protein
MKKISLFLVFFIFGCQSLTKQVKTITKIEEEPVIQRPIITQPKFDSSDLGTQKSNEKKISVALFLPISGKNKDLALSLYNSSVLSLFENDLNHNIELVLIDSKDTPDEAKKAFKEIVNRKIKVVIGPVFSNLVDAIEQEAKQNKITAISLSNNQELIGKTNSDGGVFIAGMLPETQIDKIVSYSLQRGKFSFASIAPSNQYGNTLTKIFKKIVKNRDGNFITSEFYKSNDLDIDRAVKNTINSFVVPARFKAQKNQENFALNDSNRTYPQVILIPESGKTLSKIVSSIKKQNVDERDFQIIGTSQWDEISTLNDNNLYGSWFSAPESEKFRNFEKSYYQAYNKFPPRISSIPYDLVASLSRLIDLKQKQTPSINDFINYENPPKNGFDGIDGLFRFLPNGLVQRNLAVLKVGSARFETIEKPIEQFLKY